MKILWKYLKPYQGWVFLALLLAGIAQILALYDPIIFGKVIDKYALNPEQLPEKDRIRGVSSLLAIAVLVALLSRVALTFKDYVVRLVVQKFGMQVFNDGLRQTLRLPYQDFDTQSSGETLSKLQKVRNDTERFMNSFINILFSSLVGICFLIWYAITKHWFLSLGLKTHMQKAEFIEWGTGFRL